MSYIFEKTLVLYIICSKCENEHKKIFKEKESTEILKNFGLIKDVVFISQEFRLENYRWNKKLFCRENRIKWRMSKTHKKICMTLNYIEHFLVLASVVTGHI